MTKECFSAFTDKRILKFFISSLTASVLMLTGCQNSSQKKYTYRGTFAACSQWNPTEWKYASDGLILSHISTPFYDFIPNTQLNGYEVFPELALSEPEDQTILYAGNPVYGIPQDADRGYAWKIQLTQNACWDDGTGISADTVEYTIRQYLNPKAHTYRSNIFYTEGLPLANAREYYSESIEYVPVVSEDSFIAAADDEMWTSLCEGVYFLGGFSIEEFGSDWWLEEGKEIWDQLTQSFGTNTYVRLTMERKRLLQELARLWGNQDPEAYREFCFVKQAASSVPWDNVGFIRNDDYTFTLIFSHQLSRFMVEYQLSSLYLLKPDLYEACLRIEDDSVTSTYGTSRETSASYGPYSITDFKENSHITLGRNENWFGWTDGRHEGQYMTTGFHYTFTSGNAESLDLFLRGKLDHVNLDPESAAVYRDSPYLLITPETYTLKLSINIDREMLESENSEGINHSILANRDFRKALALAVNRESYIRNISPDSMPGYGLINGTYISDPVQAERYRDTEEAKASIYAVYGTFSPQGNNMEKAKNLMQKAYEQELSEGKISQSDVIEINFYVYSDSETDSLKAEFLQDTLRSASMGTDLEDRIIVRKVVSPDFYSELKSGKADMAITAWGGSELDPFGLLWCYNTQEAVYEYGFHPEEELLTVKINGENITKTYTQWYEELCRGSYADAESSIRVRILAANERSHLERYNMIPLEYRSNVSMNSMRLVEYSDHYINSLVDRGGIRFLTYTMDDEKWEQFCSRNGNRLLYTSRN